MATEIIVPSRSISVRQFERRLNRLSGKHRKLLTDHLGEPPDPANIPKEIWKQIDDENAALLILLVGAAAINTLRPELFRLERAAGETIETEDVLRELSRNARARAKKVAKWTTDTTRKRIKDLFGKDGAPTPTAGVRDVLNPSRTRTIAENESIAAETVARETVRKTAEKKGLAVVQVWRLGPCNHCKVCPLLDRTPDSFWRLFSAGPPLHPHCCCSLETYYELEESLRDRGIIRITNPSQSQVFAAIRDSRF